MPDVQPGILADVPEQARYLSFSIADDGDLTSALRELAGFADGDRIVVGIGVGVADALDRDVDGLMLFPRFEEAQVELPATNAALWCWLRGSDRGELVHLTHTLVNLISSGFECDQIVDGFKFDIGRDLTGYEDGTENPTGDEAVAAAIAADGSSFVAVQQWVHDLDDFLTRPESEQDDTIGRRKSDNEEMEDAPETAHVKRTAQEDFDPEAFVLRRSMPWADSVHEGLIFVAFGKNFEAYTALLKRMSGAEDGIVDALFSFSTPVTGSFFWCPPMTNGKLDLFRLGIGV